MKLERLALLLLSLVCQNLVFCCCLNDEAHVLLRLRERVLSDPFGALLNWNSDNGQEDPCSWSGVECSDGKVVVLNLEDLCLQGTLGPELKNLIHIKFILLRNNSFTGTIPEGLGELKELEVVDLGHNNFTGPLPNDLDSNLSLTVLLLDNSGLFGSESLQVYQLQKLSEFQGDRKLVTSSWSIATTKDAVPRRLIQTAPTTSSSAKDQDIPLPEFPIPLLPEPFPASSLSPSSSPSPSPLPSPSPSPSPLSSLNAPSSLPSLSASPNGESTVSPSQPSFSTPLPSPSQSPTFSSSSSGSYHHRIGILAGSIGAAFFLFIAVAGLCLCKDSKVATVRPWATGLSGQLQKAFVTGVPRLKRAELESACEDFSNVIGSLPIGTVYKGTLSNGVEIAVASVVAASSKDWSKNLKSQFRKKIDTLSKVNHRNFLNLLGYCEEEEPFTRMMVFEYAPNGTLFEHLHIQEAEHLDWEMRLRIAMGMAYCLEHMHQLNPPVVHNNLNASAVYLTEDYAAKISDFTFHNELAAATTKPLNFESATPASNVYSFAVILFEMLTGRLPYSMGNASLEDWVSDYLRGGQAHEVMVDPTLNSYVRGQMDKVVELIKACTHPHPKNRPNMKEVTAILRDITSVSPERATPRLSPLWWAELEVYSADAS